MKYATSLKRWNSLNWKVRSGLSFALVMLLSGAFGTYQAKSAQVSLFAKTLTSDQVNEIDSQLADWGISFNAKNNTVLVERSQRSNILIRLSMIGIPRMRTLVIH